MAAMPAPNRINHGKLSSKSFKSCRKEVFFVNGFILSLVHENVNQKKRIARKAKTTEASCHPKERSTPFFPKRLKISTKGSAAAKTSKLPPKAKIKRNVASVVLSFPSADITPSNDA